MMKQWQSRPEGAEKIPYTEEDFYREISEREKRILGSPRLSDEEIRAITNIGERAQAQDEEMLKGLDAATLRRRLVSRKLNNFRNRMPGATWGTRGLTSGYTGIQKLQYIEGRIKRGTDGGHNTLQILRDIDKTIVKLGYNVEKVKEWAKNNYEDHADDLVKIYCAMRRLGYRHYPDLTQ